MVPYLIPRFIPQSLYHAAQMVQMRASAVRPQVVRSPRYCPWTIRPTSALGLYHATIALETFRPSSVPRVHRPQSCMPLQTVRVPFVKTTTPDRVSGPTIFCIVAPLSIERVQRDVGLCSHIPGMLPDHVDSGGRPTDVHS